MNKKPYIVDTTLRDGQQSLIATRLKMEDFEDQLIDFDQVGYYSMEVWGGATYDSCIRYLNEDPWKRLQTMREKLKNTKIQMLLRGQNLVGYRNYADDVVELFVNKVADYNMDIIRVFDALNDIRNLEKSIEVAKKRNIHVQGAICYTVSPVHNLQYYLNYTKELVERGVDSIVVKDMAGLLKPKDAYDLVKEIKKKFNILVDIHSHATTGLASMAYFAGVEAGADILDLALSPFANGTSEPAIEPFVYTYDLDLNTKTIMKLVEHFWKVRSKYSEYDVKMQSIDARILTAQIPGGMLSNLISQLKSQKAEDKLNEVLQEVPKVRKDLGYPPLVTPTSQIVGVQAVLNVLTGKRYSMITNEVKNYLKGLYGKPPASVDEELYELALGNDKPIDYRPADDLEPELEKAKKEIGILAQNEEDLLTYVLFKEVGKKFLKDKYVRSLNIDLNLAESFQNEDTVIYPI